MSASAPQSGHTADMPNKMNPDDIRALFSQAMSDMYRSEVPLYGTLIDLVRDINAQVLAADPTLKAQLEATDELARLGMERHGAIRLGTAQELGAIRRMFAVMGMYPVGYYDLSVAGIPVHSTAFRPITASSLKRNPFRIFTSLLRLDLIEDSALVTRVEHILSRRQIVSAQAFDMINLAEKNGGLTSIQAKTFVAEALDTFRWRREATVDAETYAELVQAHRLIADVVSFKGPHINHLTPRTLDIDAVQQIMPAHGITPKAIVEGPPNRQIDILLRQTAFKALEEEVVFQGVSGSHLARFGEIEQRGVALTPKGRALYDATLTKARADSANVPYTEALETAFSIIPDNLESLRVQGLAFFHYRVVQQKALPNKAASLSDLIASGALFADPQVYEDFLPVSAAGIFQSNLASEDRSNCSASMNKQDFETALGAPTTNEMALYAKTESESLQLALTTLGQTHLMPLPTRAP